MSTSKPEFESARLQPPAVNGLGLTPHAATKRRFRRRPDRTLVAQPSAYLNVQVDGREASYFKWLGAGVHSVDRSEAAQNGQPHFLHELHYGFSERFFYLRVDPFLCSLSTLRAFEFRITLRSSEELRLLVDIDEGKFSGCLLDTEDICILGPHELVKVAFDKILEVAIGRMLIALAGQTSLTLEVALWHAGLSLDVLPRGLPLQLKLGVDAFAWPIQ